MGQQFANLNLHEPRVLSLKFTGEMAGETAPGKEDLEPGRK